MSEALIRINKLRTFIFENIKELCIEQVELNETGILKDGKTREAHRMIIPGLEAYESRKLVASEIGRCAMALVATGREEEEPLSEKVAPIDLYRVRNDATNLYSNGGHRWNVKGKLFTAVGPVKNSLRDHQNGIARDREIYGRDERFATHLPAEIVVVKYKLVEVEVTSANDFLGIK
jgi:hypothetical protein